MQKFLMGLVMIGLIAECSFSPALAFQWFKPAPTDSGEEDTPGDRDVSISFKSGDSTANPTSPFTNTQNNSTVFKPSGVNTSNRYDQQRSGFPCSELVKICPQAPANCEKARKVVGNGEALDYTLQYLSDNYERLQDPSCHSGSSHGNNIKEGFSNASNGKGKFALIDTDTRLANGRAQAHYVDLCKGEYHAYGSKMGTGKTFLDSTGKHSTLTGAFMTGKDKRQFTPYTSAGYKRAGLFDPKQVELVGLNSSNDRTDESKPMHESPFNTSWGCPSIDRSDFDLLGKIKGGNLVMSYRRGYMQKLGKSASCKNGSGSGSGFSPESAGQRGVQ